MHVIATAGHVDHGKSTLVRALTGMEPDRWAEERRRGMTIDLGYAWTTLPSGAQVGFVDVPGHERFIGNMLAGLGPAPAVLFVVAADEGWRRQSAEHLAAVNALGLTSGLLAVTRSDAADPDVALREAREQIALSSLADVEAVAVSGVTGEGLEQLRAALDRLIARLPPPDPTSPVRLWVDRSFTIRGAGTVVTGTLDAGTLHVDDELELHGRQVRIRGLQSLGTSHNEVSATSRVGVNLRSVHRADVHRGDTLLTPGAWRSTSTLDVRLDATGGRIHTDLVLHIGTVALPVHVRALNHHYARLTTQHPVPVTVGDRAILRDPGAHRIIGGVVVLDADPPALRLRGAATGRAEELATTGNGSIETRVRRQGAVRRADFVGLGVSLDGLSGVREAGAWLIARETWATWAASLLEAVDSHAKAFPLDPAQPTLTARRAVGVPDLQVLIALATEIGLDVTEGRIRRPTTVPSLGPAESGLCEIESRLRVSPFAAPERGDLNTFGLTPRQLAAAEKLGRITRLGNDIVLLPSAPALAIRLLRDLPQPFTISQARQVLRTTRRVVVPLLEHLDGRGWTCRVDDNNRVVTENGAQAHGAPTKTGK